MRVFALREQHKQALARGGRFMHKRVQFVVERWHVICCSEHADRHARASIWGGRRLGRWTLPLRVTRRHLRALFQSEGMMASDTHPTQTAANDAYRETHTQT
jgi:hypothetical protein